MTLTDTLNDRYIEVVRWALTTVLSVVFVVGALVGPLGAVAGITLLRGPMRRA